MDNSFYSSQEWRRLRRKCFRRDGYICQRCDNKFKAEELNAHHLMPRAVGGADEIQNLISLCSPCHDFVEVEGLKDKASIIGSYHSEPKEEQPQPEQSEKVDRYHRDDHYRRPEWHKWVYGGYRNPHI